MSENEKPTLSIIVGKCSVCNEPIDSAKEGFITDADGNLYHEKCYIKVKQQ